MHVNYCIFPVLETVYLVFSGMPWLPIFLISRKYSRTAPQSRRLIAVLEPPNGNYPPHSGSRSPARDLI